MAVKAQKEAEEEGKRRAEAERRAAEAETARLRAEAQRLASEAEKKRRAEEEEERRRAAEAAEAEHRARNEAQRQLEALIADNRGDVAVRTPNQTVRVARVGKVNRPDTLAFGFDIEGGDDVDGLQPHISRIEQFSEAADAGLQVGDFIVNINGQSYAHATINKIVAALRTASRTGKLSLSIHRDYKGQRLGRLAALQQAVAGRTADDADAQDAASTGSGPALAALSLHSGGSNSGGGGGGGVGGGGGPATPLSAASAGKMGSMPGVLDTSTPASRGKGRSPPGSADAVAGFASPASGGARRNGRVKRSLSATPRRAMVKPKSTEAPSSTRRLSASDLAEMREDGEGMHATYPGRAPGHAASDEPTLPGRSRRGHASRAGGDPSTSPASATRQSSRMAPAGGSTERRRASHNMTAARDLDGSASRPPRRVSAHAPLVRSSRSPSKSPYVGRVGGTGRWGR